MRRLDSILKRLWREPASDVIETYDAMVFGGLDTPRALEGARNGLLAAKMRDLRRPLLRRDKSGLRVSEAAAQLHMERETLARLMVRHGILELVPFGGRQSRRLVTDQAFYEGLGHNVDPSSLHSPRLSGHSRSSVFPVIYADQLSRIAERLGWSVLQDTAASIRDKRSRMRWLLAEQADLPDEALATLSGYSLRGVKKARALRRQG